MGVLVLLMIGVYKSGKESVNTEEEYIQVYSDDKDFIEESYFLIVGSFLDKYNAEGFQQTMADLGYETKVLECEDGYFRVYIFSSIYKEEVYRTKDQYSHEINKMWVYSLK